MFQQFSDINILQNSVGTRLRCVNFAANLLLSVRVKEFRKLVNISHEFGVFLGGLVSLKPYQPLFRHFSDVTNSAHVVMEQR